jgi:hypothetical protein
MLIQDVPGGKVNIAEGHCIGHYKQKSVYLLVSYSERFPRQLFHCNGKGKVVPVFNYLSTKP